MARDAQSDREAGRPDRPGRPEPDRVDCVICGQRLTGDPDDQPDWPTGPLCAECYRAQQLDDEMAADEGT